MTPARVLFGLAGLAAVAIAGRGRQPKVHYTSLQFYADN